ncbi:MAG: class I SAM-dependent methyltransferase [Mogibacterium sp.]|nr:class I SAM-dependent methyltransferase [Mogibacterium sp.]
MKRKTQEKLKAKSARYFDLVAEREEIIPEPVKCYEYVLGKLTGMNGGALADIGCGTGNRLAFIHDQFGDRYSLYGIDLSPESLKRAEALCGSFAQLSVGDVEALPYEDGTFDLLLCMHSFHHYPRPLLSLQEMRRVLKPGGTLLLVENDYPPMFRRKTNLKQFLLRYPGGDIRMYSRKRLYALARKAGFTGPEPVHIAHHSQLLELHRP